MKHYFTSFRTLLLAALCVVAASSWAGYALHQSADNANASDGGARKMKASGVLAGQQLSEVSDLQESSTWAEAASGAVADTDYSVDGSGNYTVNTALGLAYVASVVNGGESLSGKTVTLSADINLNETNKNGDAIEWTSMGAQTAPFSGTFDGGDHTVSYTQTSQPGTNNGLIGYAVNAAVKNVKIGAGSKLVAVKNNFGAVVGKAIDTTIDNCHNSANIDGLASYVAGIVADAVSTAGVNGTVVSNCSNTGNITISTPCTATSHGGVIGHLGDNNAGSYAYNLFNSGDIEGTMSTGGVIGFLQSPTKSKQAGGSIVRAVAENCYNTGSVKGVLTHQSKFGNQIGGLCGYANVYSGIVNSVNAGVVTATGSYAGGVVGYYQVTSGSTGDPSEITNCYTLENSATATSDVNNAGNQVSSEELKGETLSKTLSLYAGYLNAQGGKQLNGWTSGDPCPVFGDAVAAAAYKLAVGTSENGSIEITSPQAITVGDEELLLACEGDDITVTATADEDYEFLNLVLNGEKQENGKTTAKAVAADMTLTAEFAEIIDDNVDISALEGEIEEAKKLLKYSMSYYDEHTEDPGKALVDAIREAEDMAENAKTQNKTDKALETLQESETEYANALMEYELAESESIQATADAETDELAAELERLYNMQDVVREDYSNQPKNIKNYADELDKAQKAYLRKAINELIPQAQAVAADNADLQKTIEAAKNAVEGDSSEEMFEALQNLQAAMETATGIRGIEAADTNDTPAYNLSGQRVSKNAKGIIVKNGRKYVK